MNLTLKSKDTCNNQRTKYWSVFSISSIDLTPAQMTVTGVLPNSLRSELTSIEFSPSRWTPPTPPVTKNFILFLQIVLTILQRVKNNVENQSRLWCEKKILKLFFFYWFSWHYSVYVHSRNKNTSFVVLIKVFS